MSPRYSVVKHTKTQGRDFLNEIVATGLDFGEAVKLQETLQAEAQQNRFKTQGNPIFTLQREIADWKTKCGN